MKTLLLLLLFPAALSAQIANAVSADTAAMPPTILVFYTDADNQPMDYTVTEYYAAGKPYTIYDITDHFTVCESGRPVPPQFVHRVKVDSTMHLSYIRGKGITPMIPDSIDKVDFAELDSFYLLHPIHPDTVFVTAGKAAGCNDGTRMDMRSNCHYKGAVKNGKETGYYDIHELKGLVVRENFRIRYTGQWKKGKKSGKWKYYSREGRLLSIEKWKNDKLKKERKMQ